MSNRLPSFLKRDGLSLLYKDDGEMIFYIPEIYFERGFIVVDGDRLSVLGLFSYARFDKSNNLIGSLKMFNFPSIFTCVPSSIDKIKNAKLTKNSLKDDYRLLKFKKDDIVVLSTKVPKLIDNMELFLKMFNTGRFPNTIPYDRLHEVFIKNAELNGNSYPVTAQLIGVIISEICRSASDTTKPYRLSKTDDLNAYTGINITNIPKLISPFTAITSENWDESIVSAITNDKYTRSPMERLIYK